MTRTSLNRNPEQDLRVKLFNTLLTTPHRNLADIYPVHQEIAGQDPRFYVQLAAWYAAEGEVRDHQEMFVINLVLSDFPGHRDVGLALLRGLPPYQVGRVLDFIKGRVIHAKTDGGSASARVNGPSANGGNLSHPKQTVGLGRNVPRSMKTEISRYLREREGNPAWFDASVLQARSTMKRLYASLHVKPSQRAQAILFEENPPADSRLFALKMIAAAQTPAEQAQAIVEHKIPYRVASSVIKQMTPMVLVALINSMTPQEAINNMGALKRHGAFDNADVKKLVEGKLEAAQGAKRVSAFKAKEAAKSANLSTDLVEKLDQVTESQIKAKGTIVRPTALLIDKSSSMTQAIELGKRIGSMIAGVCEADLFVYAFDSIGYPIEVVGSSLTAWERALAGIYAGGMTSCGVALEMMRRQKQSVEQIIMITDEGDNTNPRFVEAFQAYCMDIQADPQVIFVKTENASNQLEQACQQARITCDAYQFTGDYYALPNLLPLLTRPSKLDLVLEIMTWPLPKRKAA